MKTGSSISAATRWVTLVGGEDYTGTTQPRSIGLQEGGSATLEDALGNTVTITAPGYHPVSPTKVLAAVNAFALF